MADEMQKVNQEIEIPMRPATSDRNEPRPSGAGRLKTKRQQTRQGRRKGGRR